MIRNSDRETTPGITNMIARQLRKSQPWIYLLAWAGIISSVLSMIGIVSLFKYSAIYAAGRILVTIIQLIVAIFLIKYARSINAILASGSSKDLGIGLSRLNKVWILMGIEFSLTVVITLISQIRLLLF